MGDIFVTGYEPWQLEDLCAKSEKKKDLKDLGYYHHISFADHAHAAIDSQTGEVLAIAGVHMCWPGRYEAFALLGSKTQGQFFRIHRLVSKFIKFLDAKRLECVVDSDFVEGQRWVKTLGFELQSLRMDSYLPNGNAAYMYAKFGSGRTRGGG